jgi:hypothetical protein
MIGLMGNCLWKSLTNRVEKDYAFCNLFRAEFLVLLFQIRKLSYTLANKSKTLEE